jgi:hypothetical protein
MDFGDLETNAPFSPVAYYRMGEGITNWNGTNWQLPDYSKNALFSQKSFQLDGVDQYVGLGSTLSTSGDDVTISFWFKAVNIAPADPHTTGAFVWGDSNNFVYYNVNETLFATVNGLASALNTGTGGVPVVFGDDEWHHLAFIRTVSTAVWYIDGAPYADVWSNYGAAGFTMDEIGADGSGTAYYLNGSMDDVAIFENDQTDNIADIYNSGVPSDLSAMTGLVGYWTFDDATFDTNWTVPDNSTNSNNGTSVNMDEVDLKFNSPGNTTSGLSDSMGVDDVVNDAPSNQEQGLSVSMDVEDRESTAPDNLNQANSVSMDETAPPDGRSTETP